jgi:hypothetical protein
MMVAWMLLAAASPALDFDMRDFGEDAIVYGARPAPTDASATLLWPRDTILRMDDGREELVLHFDRPVDEASIARFEAAMGDRIETLRWNDDSLLLRPRPDIRLSSKVDGNRLTVTLLPDGMADAPGDMPSVKAADASGDRDLAIVAIRADLASGFIGKARRGAERLVRFHPEDRDVRRLLADIQAIEGNHHAAAISYRVAEAEDMAARRSMAQGPGQASIGAAVRDGTGFTQIEGVARAIVTPTHALTVNAAVRHVETQANTAIVGDNMLANVNISATLTDVTIVTQIAPLLHLDLTGSLWLDTGVAGGGVRLAYGSSDTQFRIGYIHRLPDLSFAEQAIDQGRLSQFIVGGSVQLLPELRGRVDLSWRRYGLSNDADAAETLTLAGQLDYILLRRPLTITFGYRLDAEYVQNLTYTPAGIARLPLSDRENHTVQAFASGAIGPILMTGGAGWTIDRYGGSGPNASLAASAPIGLRWQVDTALGVTSITRPGFPGRQLFGRVELRRALGDGS